jgi:hypothetical protein
MGGPTTYMSTGYTEHHVMCTSLFERAVHVVLDSRFYVRIDLSKLQIASINSHKNSLRGFIKSINIESKLAQVVYLVKEFLYVL